MRALPTIAADSRSLYRPDLDGLRCIAVLSVVVFHAFPGYLDGGFIGVDIFFVISGFLITRILLREPDKNYRTLTRFYGRRIRRIFPALITTLCGVLFLGWMTLQTTDYAKLGEQVVASGGFFANIFFIREINYFNPDKINKVLLHIWSLGVEEQFYIAWPLIVFLLSRFKLGATKVLGLVATCSLIYCIYLTFADPNLAFYSPLSRCWELGAGGMLASVLKRDFVLPMPNTLSCVGGGVMLGSLFLLSQSDLFPGLGAIPAVVGTALVIAAGPQAHFNRLLSLRPAVWIGLISYPLYLWHWPILSFAYIENAFVLPTGVVRLQLMFVALVLACLTFLVIERPARRLHPAVLMGAMLSVIILGAVIARNGFPERPVNRDGGKRLIAEYARLFEEQSRTLYRPECDFMDWKRQAARDVIASSCTKPGRRGTYLLWGDSHAQALSYGLRSVLPDGIALAQVASIGCHPQIGSNGKQSLLEDQFRRSCRRSNEAAMLAIRKLRPDILFLVQATNHEDTNWEALARHAVRHGAKRVVLIGPVPQWRPSLPAVASRSFDKLPTTALGLDQSVFVTDAELQRRHRRSFEYVSLIAPLCARKSCLSRAGNRLLVVDYGHLSPEGSLLAARIISSALALKSNGSKRTSRTNPVSTSDDPALERIGHGHSARYGGPGKGGDPGRQLSEVFPERGMKNGKT